MPGTISLEATLWAAIAALVSAIDGHNKAAGHSMRVADYAVRAASAMGWRGAILEQIRLGALLLPDTQNCSILTPLPTQSLLHTRARARPLWPGRPAARAGRRPVRYSCRNGRRRVCH